MAKYFGPVGYVKTVETRPGVHMPQTIEHNYYSDVLKAGNLWSTTPETTNDDLRLNCQFSIVADPYAIENWSSIKYIEYMGVKWKVTSVEPKFPRLLLNVGGKYNGK